MTLAEKTGALFDVLVLELCGACFVVMASDVDVIELDADGVAESTEGLHLGDLLGCSEAASHDTPRALVVKSGDTTTRLLSSASFRLECLAAQAFYRLPRLLREAGCPKWVCGVTVLADSTQSAIWLDLRELALISQSLNTTKGKQK